ncbi:hypothetical protein KCU95_g12296, partial [Aureobasidium melanogenum]
MIDKESASPAGPPKDNGNALPAPPSPTRILLRLPKKEWVWESHRDAIVAYLQWANRSVSDFEQGKHECYVEFEQDPEVPQKRYHIAIDLYALSYEVKDMKDVRDGKDVEHEIYAVRRDTEGQIRLYSLHTSSAKRENSPTNRGLGEENTP